jgi:prepilin-type N-terminal cleavage/methylation domain-containing protein
MNTAAQTTGDQPLASPPSMGFTVNDSGSECNQTLFPVVSAAGSGPRITASDAGFTLVEILLAVTLLGLLAAGVSMMYASGLKALDVQSDRILLDSALRSRMEFLIGTSFDELTDGGETIQIRSTVVSIYWKVEPADLNGDGAAEAGAKKIIVTAPEQHSQALTVIVVDHEGRVAKI